MNEFKTEEEQLIEKLSTNPIYFIEVFLGRSLSEKQKLFIEKTMSLKHIVAIWSRQTGKSTVIASYIIWRILYGKGQVTNGEWMPEHIAIVAPIKDQIRNLYEKMKTLVDKSDFIDSYVTKMNTEIMRVKNGNEAKFFSASPGSQIRGYTATCIIIDESQDVTDIKYSADILPFGATTNALIIEAGTPKTKNHFYRTMMNKNILVIKQPWYECPFLSEAYVMAQKNLSPESLWRQEYLCEFVEEGVLAFPSALFEPEEKNGKLTGKWNLGNYDYITKMEQFTRDKAVKIQEDISKGASYVAGLDLGKQNDNTVFTIMRVDIRPIRIEVQIIFPLGMDYTLIAQKLAVFYRIFEPYEFNIDYSNEKMFVEELLKNGINVTHTSENKRGAIAFTIRNKTEMVSTARVLLEQYQLQLPKKAENLISEFLNQQFEITQNNLYKYFHPSNEHDDSLWSTLLALKNMHIEVDTTKIDFVNVWEEHDESIKKSWNVSTREVMFVNKQRRNRDRYTPANMRRRGSAVRL